MKKKLVMKILDDVIDLVGKYGIKPPFSIVVSEDMKVLNIPREALDTIKEKDETEVKKP